MLGSEIVLENSTKGKRIKVTFVSEVREGSKKEITSFETIGLYYIKDKVAYLSYDEEHEDGKVRNIVKIKDQEVLITRSGPVSMRQFFKNKEVTSGTYKSQYANLLMETKTDNIEYRWNEKNPRGQLFIAYSLKVNGEGSRRHTITIKFREEAAK